jgi:hypothetical protein
MVMYANPQNQPKNSGVYKNMATESKVPTMPPALRYAMTDLFVFLLLGSLV